MEISLWLKKIKKNNMCKIYSKEKEKDCFLNKKEKY